MLTITQFMLQLVAMLILSGALTLTGLLAVFRAWDWWCAR